MLCIAKEIYAPSLTNFTARISVKKRGYYKGLEMKQSKWPKYKDSQNVSIDGVNIDDIYLINIVNTIL